jgi:malonyl-CoA/methylmalonyl-CoA synthetase
MKANLFELFAHSISDPGRIAIETGAGERYSYGDLIGLSGRLANALVALGVEPGDRVAVQAEKSVAALVL